MPTSLFFIEYFLYGFTKEIWWNLMLNRVHINVSCSCISGLVIFGHHFNYITKKFRKHFVTYMNAKSMFSIGCFLIFSVSQFNKRYCSPRMLHIPSCNFNTVPLEVFIAAFFSYFASFIVASAMIISSLLMFF